VRGSQRPTAGGTVWRLLQPSALAKRTVAAVANDDVIDDLDTEKIAGSLEALGEDFVFG
jgi:hypothetical protein